MQTGRRGKEKEQERNAAGELLYPIGLSLLVLKAFSFEGRTDLTDREDWSGFEPEKEVLTGLLRQAWERCANQESRASNLRKSDAGAY